MLEKLRSWAGQGLPSGGYAPTFELKDQNGVLHTLEEYAGKWLVLYFYPKDETAGCTAQACSFRDGWSEIKDLGVQLVGVSTDSVEKHKAFAASHQLPFTILADTQKKVSKDYQVLLPLGFANRVTFLIDPNGVIQKTLSFVNWKTYAETVARELRALM